MTLEEFNKIPDGEVFATGVLPNSPEGIYMTGEHFGESLKWIAIKGYAHDFAIYYHWFYYSEEYIKEQGQKVTSKGNILKCIPCDEEVINLYRF
jgi:hypothetical protein